MWKMIVMLLGLIWAGIRIAVCTLLLVGAVYSAVELGHRLAEAAMPTVHFIRWPEPPAAAPDETGTVLAILTPVVIIVTFSFFDAIGSARHRVQQLIEHGRAIWRRVHIVFCYVRRFIRRSINNKKS